MVETDFTAERCLDLIRAAAPGVAAIVTTDPWHGTHARAELDGATTVRFIYLYSCSDGRLDLHLYPADTLGQARALYGDPSRVTHLLDLQGAWELRPNFHFGFAAKGLTGTTSSIGAEAYVEYWMARIATLETFPRANWQGELEKLVADGIFSADDVPQFERDFTETEPLSPTLHDPNFDVAWEHEGTFYVAEIKSVTDQNEERQLRLGLGQIIRFRSLLASRLDRQVRTVLVPERRSRDDAWRATCEGVGVELIAADELARRLPSLLESAVA